MMQIIQLESELNHAQQQFVQFIQSALHEQYYTKIQCISGRFETTVHYSPQLDIWYFFQMQENKYWNAFGLGKPIGKSVKINLEVNTPKLGIQSALSGVFAKDNNGALYLLHRGKIRGGKALFFQHYRGELIYIEQKGKLEPFALVSELNHRLADNIENFIRQILNIKAQK